MFTKTGLVAIWSHDRVLLIFFKKGVTPYNTHNFYTEETGDFKLFLNYITDVKIHKKRLFQTTLLNNLHTTPAFVHLQNTYSNLPRAITVRCALFEKNDYATIRIMKTPPVVENPDQKLASKHWDDFKYNSRGKPFDNPLLQFEDEKPGPSERPEEQLRPNNIQNNDMARVEAWADRVPDMKAQSVSNFFIPPAPLHDAPTPRPAPSRKCLWGLGCDNRANIVCRASDAHLGHFCTL